MAVNRIILSLGSNLGDRLQNIQSAVDFIAEFSSLMTCSRIYETPAWGFESDSTFYNICLEVKSGLSPEELLKNLKLIEKKIGRTKITANRYESRLIDIDIIFYGDLIYHSNTLSIPHSHYDRRDFVLFPLHEIAGDWIDPLNGKSVGELMRNFENVTVIKPINPQIFINK